MTNRFRFERDMYGWTLYETIKNTGPNAKRATRERSTFHGTLEQAAREAMDRGFDAEDLLAGIKKAKEEVIAAVKAVG